MEDRTLIGYDALLNAIQQGTKITSAWMHPQDMKETPEWLLASIRRNITSAILASEDVERGMLYVNSQSMKRK